MSNGNTYIVSNYNNLYVDLPTPQPPIIEPTGANASFTKPNNPDNLLVGTGNSNKSMVTATDGIIELAMASRLWQPQSQGSYNPVVVPVDSTYTIPLDKSKLQEYTIPFSIGIISSEFIGKITDLYNVTLTFYGDNTGLMTDNNISWRLVYSNGQYILKDTKYGQDIIDSAVNPQLTVIQNIERYKFFKQYLKLNPPQGEIPTGIFVTTIVATHLESGKILELKVITNSTYQ